MPLLPDKMAEGCCCTNKCIVVRNCPTLLPHVHTGPNTTKLTSANISHSPHQALSSPCGLTTWTKHDRLYGKILLSNIITYSMPARNPVSSCSPSPPPPPPPCWKNSFFTRQCTRVVFLYSECVAGVIKMHSAVNTCMLSTPLFLLLSARIVLHGSAPPLNKPPNSFKTTEGNLTHTPSSC